MKTVLKRVLFGLLAFALTLSLVACGGDSDATATTTTTTTTAASNDSVITTVSTEPGETTTTQASGSQPSGTSSTTATTASTTKAPTGSNQKLSWAQVKAGMPASLRGTKITIFNWNELNSITDGEKSVANFEKETGITVEWIGNGVYSNYVTEIAARQAAKNAPDIVRMKEVDPARMAQLQPLSNTGYDFSDAAWDQTLMGMYSYKGKAYATNLANTLMQQPNVYQYNKSLIEQYDLEDPFTLWKKGKWTWSKFMEICTQFQDDVGDSKNALSANFWIDPVHMLGSDMVKYTSNGYVNNFRDQKIIQGMRMYIKMREAGMINTKLYARQAFEAGNILFMHDTMIGTRKSHFDNRALKASGDLAAVPLPKIDGQNEYYQLFRELEAYGVPTGAKNIQAVPYFLRYFLDAENYDEKNFFYNSNILEVYKFCMSQKNRVMSGNYYSVFTEDTSAWGLTYKLYNASEGQLATIVGSDYSVAEAAVRQANTILSKLG